MSNPQSETPPNSGRISLIEHILIVAATAVITAAVLQAPPLQSANDRSRWATVWSLVERKTFQIDEIDAVGRWSTIDKVRYRTSETEPWHFYSSKPPLLSTIVAGLYAIERNTLGYGLFNDTALVTRLLLLIVNVLPFYLTLRSLRCCLLLIGSSMEVRMFVLAVAGFGSILNPYLTTLNNHTPAVACAMFSITAAARILRTRRASAQTSTPTPPAEGQPRAFDFAALGFFTALTCCFELPAAQMGVIAFLLVAVVNRRWTLTGFLPAAAIPLISFFVTNWMATGGVKPFYATYGSETYMYEHNGIPSYWTNPRDLDANNESPVVYLFHCVLGHHGLLSLTPVLLLSLTGWGSGLRFADVTGRRALIACGALMTLVTLGFYLTRTQNYNYGGNSVGLRWMLWLSPFWWIAMVPTLEKITRHRTQCVAIILLTASIISVSWSLNRPWRPSWLYEQMESAGWIHYRTPVEPFNPKRASVLSSVPLNANTAMTWVSNDGHRLKLMVLESLNTSETKTVKVQADLDGDRLIVLFDHEGLTSGQTIEECVRTDSSEDLDRLRKIQKILRGLPESRYFNAAGSTWIPSKSDRTRAWKVDRGAARVVVEDRVFGNCWHRCDVLFCDQLPFGVLQWKTAVTSDATGETLSTQTWIAENH